MTTFEDLKVGDSFYLLEREGYYQIQNKNTTSISGDKIVKGKITGTFNMTKDWVNKHVEKFILREKPIRIDLTLNHSTANVLKDIKNMTGISNEADIIAISLHLTKDVLEMSKKGTLLLDTHDGYIEEISFDIK